MMKRDPHQQEVNLAHDDILEMILGLVVLELYVEALLNPNLNDTIMASSCSCFSSSSSFLLLQLTSILIGLFISGYVARVCTAKSSSLVMSVSRRTMVTRRKYLAYYNSGDFR